MNSTKKFWETFPQNLFSEKMAGISSQSASVQTKKLFKFMIILHLKIPTAFSPKVNKT